MCVRFFWGGIVFSYRQALLPGAHQQLQAYHLLAKHLQLKESMSDPKVFKFKQKSQDRLSLLQLWVYAHLIANHIGSAVV